MIQKQRNLRVIAGSLARRRVPILKGHDVRPTTDRVRETLFNVLANQLSGAFVLDLCAGTGICGIEAISRGAAYVEFVEQNYQAVRHILQTLETFSCRQRAKVDCADAAKWLSKTNRAGDRPAWKIVLFDPPYQDRKLQFQCLYALSQHSRVNAKTLVCFESPTEMDDLPAQDIWQIERTLKFSSTSIRMLRLAQ